MNQKQKRLVLHFDVNKTIIMKDSCKEKYSTSGLTMCYMIAEAAWGKMVDKKGEAGVKVWQLAHD